jgi:hypothetical protein
MSLTLAATALMIISSGGASDLLCVHYESRSPNSIISSSLLYKRTSNHKTVVSGNGNAFS